jgi:hypothetical protein
MGIIYKYLNFKYLTLAKTTRHHLPYANKPSAQFPAFFVVAFGFEIRIQEQKCQAQCIHAVDRGSGGIPMIQ